MTAAMKVVLDAHPSDPNAFLARHFATIGQPVPAAEPTAAMEARGTPPPSKDDNESANPDQWTLSSWLTSIGATDVLAQALLRTRGAGQTELEFVRALGASFNGDAAAGHAHFLTLLRQADALDALAGRVRDGVDRLLASSAATGAELQGRFLQDGAGTLSYSGLSTFFRGLEGMVGSPDPKVEEAMAREHRECGDSHDEFSTSNYEVTTTSAIEFGFVATPEAPPAGGWPVEQKLVRVKAVPELQRTASVAALVSAGARMRQPMPRPEMERVLGEKNAELVALNEPRLLIAEGIAVRLYTGPLFVKYNGVLRGVDSDVPFLRNTLVKLCCPKATADAYLADTLSFAEARKQVNLYTTTLCAALEWHPAPPFPLQPTAAQRVYPLSSPPDATLLMLHVPSLIHTGTRSTAAS